MKAGTGDDKTDIVIIADVYDRAAIYSRDRNITSNANQLPGADLIIAVRIFPASSAQFQATPQAPLGFRLIPKLFFSAQLSAAAFSSERLNFSLLYQQRPLPGWELRSL